MAHRRVVAGSEEESEANLPDHLDRCLWLQLDVDSQSFQQIRRPGQRRGGAVAVFGDAGAGAGRDERRGGGDVEGPGPVPARTDEINDLHSDVDSDGSLEHRLHHAGDLIARLPFGAQGDDEGCHLGRGRVTGHDLRHRGAGRVAAQSLSGDEGTQRARPVESAHPAPGSRVSITMESVPAPEGAGAGSAGWLGTSPRVRSSVASPSVLPRRRMPRAPRGSRRSTLERRGRSHTMQGRRVRRLCFLGRRDRGRHRGTRRTRPMGVPR